MANAETDRDRACMIYLNLANAGLSPMRELTTGPDSVAELAPVAPTSPIDAGLLKRAASRVIAKKGDHVRASVNRMTAIIRGAAIGTFDIIDLAMRIDSGYKMSIGSIFQLARGGTDDVVVSDVNGLRHEVFMDNGTLAPMDDADEKEILEGLSNAYIAAWVRENCEL